MSTNTKQTSRLQIMHYVLSFCTSTSYGKDDQPRAGSSAFISEGFLDDGTGVLPGDLVILTAAPASKYLIGWLVEVDASKGHGCCCRYLIESLEDGSMCWWGNVGIKYFPRDKLMPEWRWTDRQWAFKDRWWHVCFKVKSAYIYRPLFPEFGGGFEVTIGLRVMFNERPEQPKRTFPDWRKVTKAMMGQCYDECAAEMEKASETRRKEREAATP